MKKSTKKTVMALFIILIFGMSSAAFVVSGFGGNLGQEDQLKPLDKYVVDGPINPQLENSYIQNGVTFLKLYHNELIDGRIVSFVDQAPETFTTPVGQVQLIVVKINSTENYVDIINLNGENRIDTLTQENIISALCENLLAPPTECAIRSLNISG